MVLIIADFAGGGTLLLLLTSTDHAKSLLKSKSSLGVGIAWNGASRKMNFT
jgi:hypothetical protein